MARTMKPVAAPKAASTTLRIEVDPLTVPRGHRALSRGGVHDTARRPSRSRAKQAWRRQLAREGRGRPYPTGPLV